MKKPRSKGTRGNLTSKIKPKPRLLKLVLPRKPNQSSPIDESEKRKNRKPPTRNVANLFIVTEKRLSNWLGITYRHISTQEATEKKQFKI